MKLIYCRLCGSNALTEVLSLGDLLVNDFPEKLNKEIPRVPITLVQCQNCDMLQAGYTAPNKLLYSRKYWFKSGTNASVVANLKQIAEIAQTYLKKDDIILDIGANDGTLLSFIKDAERVGVEPATNLLEDLKKNCEVAIDDFWDADKYWQLFTGAIIRSNKAKVITALGMFYDMENPVKFLGDIKKTLASEGVFIAELMTAVTMQESNDIGTLCHEHLMHFTWPTFKRLFETCGLEIFKIERNSNTEDGKGYRIFARHWDKGHVEFEEASLDLPSFFERVKENARKLKEFIIEKKAIGKKIYIYGASTKGNVLVQFYELGPDLIEGAIDKDPDKIGKFMLTGIPIVDESFIQDADYLWCIPYPFLDRFMRQENFKGEWIVSMPEFRIYV